MTLPIVIVGAGLAGYNVARLLRKRAPALPIVIVASDSGDYYSKPMLSNALAQRKTPQSLVLAARVAMSRELNLDIRPFTKVERIDAARREITWDGGGERFSALVLALGADALRPQFEGDGADAVFNVNDLGDYGRWRAVAESARHVVVVGAGLVGCEFANDLASVGVAVTIIDVLDLPLARFCPPVCSAALRDGLDKVGVRWRLGCRVRAIERDAGTLRIRLDDGGVVRCDAVLVAIGLRARTALARDAQLAVGSGIVVDGYMRSSVSCIYAIGDCAEQGGRVRPFVMPITAAARPLAATLAGCPEAVVYPPMPVVVKTPACPVTVLSPDPSAQGEWQCEGFAQHWRATFRDATGATRGFVLVGNATRDRQRLLHEVESNASVPAA